MVVGSILVMLFTTACGEEAQDVDWDLTERPTKDAIQWDPRFDDVFFVPAIDAMILRLPGGSVIDEPTGVGRINVSSILSSSPDIIHTVDFTYEKAILEDAYAKLTELAAVLGVEQAAVDEWFRDRSSGDDHSNHFSADGSLPGVLPSLTTRYSFDDDAPVLVAFELYWSEDADH